MAFLLMQAGSCKSSRISAMTRIDFIHAFHQPMLLLGIQVRVKQVHLYFTAGYDSAQCDRCFFIFPAFLVQPLRDETCCPDKGRRMCRRYPERIAAPEFIFSFQVIVFIPDQGYVQHRSHGILCPQFFGGPAHEGSHRFLYGLKFIQRLAEHPGGKNAFPGIPPVTQFHARKTVQFQHGSQAGYIQMFAHPFFVLHCFPEVAGILDVMPLQPNRHPLSDSPDVLQRYFFEEMIDAGMITQIQNSVVLRILLGQFIGDFSQCFTWGNTYRNRQSGPF